ncbi:MAG: TonB-dependent receptor [Prevotella sp.]|nr:TonB-dependent receptor [Prevotella sp.]
MQKKLILAFMALGYAPLAFAQNDSTNVGEAAFTFTEAQLGEDENMGQNVTIVNSNSNVYASEVGYLFSPVRFRYRALNQKYNDIYINGAPANDMESGQFRYSLVGGLNQQTRNMESALPFESNNFSFTGIGGSNNYNFRPASMATGHRITLSAANRNYTMRGMYTYNSGLNSKGWAYSANVTYRWANRGYVPGTFYNSLSYFFGIQKLLNDKHSLSFSTWGNPTERSTQGASTDEMYWLANDYQYNPYWGYQNGKVRNSRVVNDFAPAGIFTWDWNVNEKSKLTTSLFGKYSMYSSTKLNYNNTDNPHPDYWKRLPSSYYDVWGDNSMNSLQGYNDFITARDYLMGSEAARQINFDQLIYANRQASKQGSDALYYIQAKHNDVINLTLASTLTSHVTEKSVWNNGFIVGYNNARHYQTMDDLLGAESFHNINNYALGNYAAGSDELQYDLNNPNAIVGEGDVFGYDYHILTQKAQLWTSYAENFGIVHYSVAARLGGKTIQRDGNMRNGLFADNSYGKSKTAKFVEGGIKASGDFNLGHGNTLTLGMGYDSYAPEAYTAFIAPEMNNDFVTNLHNEHIFSSEIGYQLQTSWLHANISGYFNHISHATEWTCFYFDDINSFSYNSLSGLSKEYYGVEAGLDFKVTSAFNLKLIGTLSDAKNVSNAEVSYLNSTQGVYYTDVALVKNMRESSTPLTATSIILSYHQGGWFIDLNGNWYDRIYLSYSPYWRYKSNLEKIGQTTVSPQDKGHGGWMFDGSIGKSIYLKHGSLSINLMVSNILNNQRIVTGGYEQSRSDYTSSGNSRLYRFSKNPKKYYAFGTNGMLNIAYKF